MMVDDEPPAVSVSVHKCEARGGAPTLSIGKCVGPGIDREIAEDSNMLIVEADSRVGSFWGILEVFGDRGGICPDCRRGGPPKHGFGVILGSDSRGIAAVESR